MFGNTYPVAELRFKPRQSGKEFVFLATLLFSVEPAPRIPARLKPKSRA